MRGTFPEKGTTSWKLLIRAPFLTIAIIIITSSLPKTPFLYSNSTNIWLRPHDPRECESWVKIKKFPTWAFLLLVVTCKPKIHNRISQKSICLMVPKKKTKFDGKIIKVVRSNWPKVCCTTLSLKTCDHQHYRFKRKGKVEVKPESTGFLSISFFFSITLLFTFFFFLISLSPFDIYAPLGVEKKNFFWTCVNTSPYFKS